MNVRYVIPATTLALVILLALAVAPSAAQQGPSQPALPLGEDRPRPSRLKHKEGEI